MYMCFKGLEVSMLSSDRDGTDAPAITVTAIVKAQNVKLLEVGSTQIHVNHKPE